MTTMKKIKDFSILFLFLIVYLLQNSFYQIWIEHLKQPEVDETIKISYQNQLEALEEIEKNLDIDRQIEENKIYTKVIYRDPFNLLEKAILLKGEEEGIQKNMAVLQNNNLIGIITETDKKRSIVNLITKPNLKISIKVQNEYAILTTNAEAECWIEDLNKNVKLNEGDLISTSGLTNIPENIPVGTVEKVEEDDLGLIKKVKVKLNADLKNINYVTILEKGETP